MYSSVKKIEHQQPFVVLWDKLFRLLVRWLCIYPSLAIICYDLYYWLRFAEFLDIDTYKIAPPRLLGILYNLTSWEGINILIYRFLNLPVFITLPVFNIMLLYVVFQTVLAIYYLTVDLRAIVKRVYRRFIPG